jgi:hypothetical protein
VGAIFDSPTLRAMARLIDESRPAADPDDPAFLDWLERLPEEEAARLLAELG